MSIKLKLDLHRADTIWLIEKLYLYLDVVEKALDESRRTDVERISSFEPVSENDLGSQAEEWHAHELLFEIDFPSKARWSFIILVYTVFEIRTVALSEEMINRGLVIGRKFKKHPDGHVKAVRQFLPVEYRSTHVSKDIWSRLCDLRLVRNCIVHANGRPENVEKSKRHATLNVVRRTEGLSMNDDGYISLELKYCQDSVAVIKDFFDRVFTAAGFGPSETVVVRT